MLDTIKDSLKDLFDNANSRLANPFLGTLIFVWIVRNFEFVFTLFNFDDSASRLSKINYIRNYFTSRSYFNELIYNILITMSIIVITVILLLLSRLLINIYNIMLNKLNEWTNISNMVKRTSYDKLDELYKNSRSKIIELQEEALEFNDKFSSATTEFKTKIEELNKDHELSLQQVESVQEDYNKLKERVNNQALIITEKEQEVGKLKNSIANLSYDKELSERNLNMKLFLFLSKTSHNLLINDFVKYIASDRLNVSNDEKIRIEQLTNILKQNKIFNQFILLGLANEFKNDYGIFRISAFNAKKFVDGGVLIKIGNINQISGFDHVKNYSLTTYSKFLYSHVKQFLLEEYNIEDKIANSYFDF